MHVNDCGDITLFPREFRYMGANVPGKPESSPLHRRCRSLSQSVHEVSRDYLGFAFDGPGERRKWCIRRLQPDAMVLELISAGAASLDRMSVGMRVRPRWHGSRHHLVPVGEVVDGMLPGAAGPLNYRLYRPEARVRTLS